MSEDEYVYQHVPKPAPPPPPIVRDDDEPPAPPEPRVSTERPGFFRGARVRRA